MDLIIFLESYTSGKSVSRKEPFIIWTIAFHYAWCKVTICTFANWKCVKTTKMQSKTVTVIVLRQHLHIFDTSVQRTWNKIQTSNQQYCIFLDVVVSVYFSFYQWSLMLLVHLVWKPVWSVHSAFSFLVYLRTSSFFWNWTNWFYTPSIFTHLQLHSWIHPEKIYIEREFFLLVWGVRMESRNQTRHPKALTPPSFYSLPTRVYPHY